MKDGRVHNGQASAKQKLPGGSGCKLVLTQRWWYRQVTVGGLQRIFRRGCRGLQQGLERGSSRAYKENIVVVTQGFQYGMQEVLVEVGGGAGGGVGVQQGSQGGLAGLTKGFQ